MSAATTALHCVGLISKAIITPGSAIGQTLTLAGLPCPVTPNEKRAIPAVGADQLGVLRRGVSVGEIQEVLIQAIAYCGTPAWARPLAAYRTLSAGGAPG